VLARIQQLIVFAILSGMAAATGFGMLVGHPLLGLLFLALVSTGYGGVLALEFAALRRSYEPGDVAAPTAMQLICAWCVEVGAGPRVFLWRQPFRSRAEPDHVPAESPGRRGVLLVHGFFCNRGLWNHWMRRLRARGIPHVAVNLEPVFGSIDADYRATIESAVQRLYRGCGLPPVIVAHSMGGLAVRAWLAGAGPSSWHRIVTIASPHAGTRLGHLGPPPNPDLNLGQMREGSAWLHRLAAAETTGERGRFVCFWSHCDNIVFPTRTATLAGADNRHLPVTPHVHMVEHPEVFAEVLRLVDAPS
jgi:predicted alpha/beta hydrolase family esterase